MYTLLIQPIIDEYLYMEPNTNLFKEIINDTNIVADVKNSGIFYYITVKTDEEYLYLKLKYDDLEFVSYKGK